MPQICTLFSFFKFTIAIILNARPKGKKLGLGKLKKERKNK
jgi:hypothetical protein